MNGAAFHSQLASVMEVLANAAVAEICKLVDEGFALLRLEVTRAHKENMALRRRIRSLDPRAPEALADAENPCADDWKAFAALPVSRAHRKGDLAAEDAGNESAAVEQATCASLLVKEERAEEDSDPGGEQNTNLRPNAEGAAVATSSVSAKSSPGPGESTEALRSRRCALEVSALETALKVEPEKIGSIGQLQNAASARSSYASYSAVSHGCNRLRTSFAQGVGKREADDPSCSYVTEMESESSSFHSELLVAQEHEGSRAHLGSPEVKQEVMPAVDPMLDEAETEMRRVWNHSTVSSRAALAPRRRGRGDGRREREQQAGVFGIQTTKSETLTKIKPDPLDGTGYEPRETRAVPSNDTAAHSKAGRREKVFICTICGKAFNRPKKVEIHLRVHTGEKPFRCMLCGKWFAESGNLKKHQRVHTGEKPFSCTQCGRRFAWIRNLKTHQLRSHT